MSETSVPNVVIERELYDQIVAGSEVIILPIEVDAFPTAVFVFVLTNVLPAVMAAANDEEAVATAVLVLLFTAEVTAAV